jgi:hypothetical protein
LPVFGDRLANIRSWWRRCAAVKAEGMLITSWEAYRLALETTTVVDAAVANLWLDPDEDDATAMLARGLERVFKSKTARAQARALLAADTHAFSGYARWQINDRWDVLAGNESLKPYQADLRFYERLQADAYSWPKAFSASLAFRLYLAQRDLFVRQAARDVFQWRRLISQGDPGSVGQKITGAIRAARDFGRALKKGRQAARAMWNRTRDTRLQGQNEIMLAADAQRLDGWIRWLTTARKSPDLVAQATPVCGAWQLQFLVHNFAPAVQRLAVEEYVADTWRELAGRHLIEFRSWAARPRLGLNRVFSVPVGSPRNPLRLVVSGVGQLAVSNIRLGNGHEELTHSDRTKRRILGRRALRHGLPDLHPAGAGQAHILNLRFGPVG